MICNYSKVKIAHMISWWVFIAAIFSVFIFLPDINGKVLGLMGLGLACFCLLRFTACFKKENPAVVISDKGIQDYQAQCGLIPWEDIVSIRRGMLRYFSFIALEVHDPNVYSHRSGKWDCYLRSLSISLGFPLILIRFSVLSPGAEEAWEYIRLKQPNKVVGEK